MRVRFGWQDLMRALALAAFATAGLFASPGLAQQPDPGPAAAIESIKARLEPIEVAVRGGGALSVRALFDLGRAVAPLRDELKVQISTLEPRVARVETRLQQLGPAPAKDAPPEAASIASERAALIQHLSELDAPLKQARLLAVRADQISSQLTERRRSTYAQLLLVRTPSALDPSFWGEFAKAFAEEARQFGALLRSWRGYVMRTGGWAAIGTAFLVLLALSALAIFVARRTRRRYGPAAQFDTRLAKVIAALVEFARITLTVPMIVGLMFEAIDAFAIGAVPPAIDALGNAVFLALLIAAFGRGAATGLLAPENPRRRLPALDDAVARSWHRHLVWGARFLALAVFVHVMHGAISGPHVVLTGTNLLFATAVVGLLLHLVWRRPGGHSEREFGPLPLWAHGVALLFVGAIGFAVVAGYAGLAFFLAERLLVTIAVLSVFYLLLVATDALFTEKLAQDTPRGRAIAVNLGVQPGKIGLLGTLLSGGIRLLLMLVALLLLMGPWEVSAADFFESLKSLAFGFRIGDIEFSLGTILVAVAVFLLGLLLTRLARRWLESTMMPHTDLEPSLQQSIATIFGYFGFIVSLSVALAYLGIDLQKIALIAGALSVGIGFGLQSVVSNFVSGLILLTERPIRVGDMIEIGGDEGLVRRIRVRSTEVETFDRASIIIPNSDLIGRVVKNWTRTDPSGRMSVKINVGSDSDVNQVRDLLMSIAESHSEVLKSPPPQVLFNGFGGSSLEFGLRIYVGHVQRVSVVKSDINFAIYNRFRAAGIKIS
jgi:potassium efflux system protein